MLWLMFLTPNVAFMVFYQLAFLALLALSAIVKGTTDTDTLTANLNPTRHTWQIGMLLFFWLLQKRELKRFFEQQTALGGERKAQMKQKEMTHVLDCQNDSIFVVNSPPIITDFTRSNST